MQGPAQASPLEPDALRENSTLQELDLMGNSIRDAGAESIAMALRENSTLKKLQMGGNDIGAVGAQAIADALRQNSTLQQLELSVNGIGAARAVVVARAGADAEAEPQDMLDGRDTLPFCARLRT